MGEAALQMTTDVLVVALVMCGLLFVNTLLLAAQFVFKALLHMRQTSISDNQQTMMAQLQALISGETLVTEIARENQAMIKEAEAGDETRVTP